MKARIIRVGNSRAVRIPKTLLEQTGLRGEVEVVAVNGSLLIRAAKPKRPRAGWAAAFKEMARNGDDKLVDDLAADVSDWDKDEWQW